MAQFRNILLIGSLMLSAGAPLPAAAISTSELQPTGAALAFTSEDPAVARACELYKAGEFTAAEKHLAVAPAVPDGSEAAEARHQMLEVIRRVRMDFTLDEAGLLAKVKRSVPDATSDDVKRWLETGQLHTKTIDGQKRIFNREPQNLFLFCAEAKERKEAAEQKKDESWTLVDHLARVVAEAERTGQVEVAPAKHHVEYTLTVPANAKGMKAGSTLKVWLPFPQEYRQQRDIRLISATPAYKHLASSAVEGSPVGGTPQRTIYFEQSVADPSKDQVFKIVYEFNSYAYYPKLSEADAKPLPADFPKEYLSERPPHILLTPEVKELSAKIVGTETNPLARARKIFHWVSDNIPWNAEEEYCTIPSISTKGLTARRGDCGVQGLTFVTLCRAAGVPARWQSGWETKPVKSSMHDWSEVYIAPWGWLPADASYGVQHKSDDPRIRDFYLGHQDSYRIIFNLDYGRQFDPPKQSFRSEPLDSQRGEVELDGKNLYFDEWDYEMKFTTEPKGL